MEVLSKLRVEGLAETAAYYVCECFPFGERSHFYI